MCRAVLFLTLKYNFESDLDTMGYIKDLRKHVGHDALIGVGATTLVFNDKNELLLNLRSDTNTWGIPGGSMELYETIEETAIRELKEETGICAEELQLITVLSGKESILSIPTEIRCAL